MPFLPQRNANPGPSKWQQRSQESVLILNSTCTVSLRLSPDRCHLVRLLLKPVFRTGKFCHFGVGKINQSSSFSASCVTGALYYFSESLGPNLWLTIAASFFPFLTLVTWKWFTMFIILHLPRPRFPASLHPWCICPETCVCAYRSLLFI